MLSRGRWTENEAVASGAGFAQELWLNHFCTLGELGKSDGSLIKWLGMF
jgi:hypothetical protein